MKQSTLFFPTLLLLCSTQMLNAQIATTAIDSNKLEDLEPVIFQALRAQQINPYAVKTLSKKDIQKENTGQDIPYLVQFQPSIVTSSDAGNGIGYTNMSIRGTDNSRINFTLNGVPINNPESQGTFLVNIPDMASSTQSIQIQRGVGSSTNGGGAFGGSVSINNMVNEDSAQARIEGAVGSFNTYKLTVQGSTGRMKNGWAMDARLSQITSDGYIDRASSNLRSLQLLSSWEMSNTTKWTINYMLGHEKTGQAWNGLSTEELQKDRRQNTLGKMPNGAFYNNQSDNYQQQFLQTYLDHKWNANLKSQIGLFYIRGKGYYEEYRANEPYADYNLPNYSTANDTISETDLIRRLWLDNHYYGAVYNFIYQKNNWDVTFGGMVAQYNGLHYGNIIWAQQGIAPQHQWYHLDANKTEVNHYIKGQYNLNSKWIFTGELQHRYVDYSMEGFRKNPNIVVQSTYNFVNPKVGINYNFQQEANNNQSLFASYAIANKEPNRDDFEAGIHEIPKHESLGDLEIGYQGLWKKWRFYANYYYMHYNNQLVLNGKINDVGAYTRVNVGNSYRTGIELELQYEILNNLKFAGNATLAQNKIKSFIEYKDNWDTWGQETYEHKNTDIAFSPNMIAALSVTWEPLKNLNIHPKHKELELQYQWKYVGQQYLDNTQNDERKIDAYQYSNINIRYTFPTRNGIKLYAGLSIQNLTNTLYSSNGYTYSYLEQGRVINSNYYFPQAGTYFMARLGIKF